MTHWNYRVIHNKDEEGNEWYDIREVYYHEDGTPCMTTSEPCYPHGETLEELFSDLQYMLQDSKKEVLEMDFFKAEHSPCELSDRVEKVKKGEGFTTYTIEDIKALIDSV